MAQKRALVVDDSRAARVALQRMLERYEVQVDFAESGEDAIEYLRNQVVDVIFMDHSMPGMDGFEAVSAIKADPRTALIPVMMYTAKEGEVYVGQARALGAVGVLPKDVKPGVLFEMLLKLGLVTDRRAALRRRTEEAETKAEREDETDRALERQAMGASIQALITRTLQDQHLELRTDILASNRDFARRVAEEIWARQKAEAELARQEAAATSAQSPSWGVVATLLVLAIVPIALLFLLFSQASQQRDEAVADNVRLRQTIAAQAGTIDTLAQDAPLGPRTAAAGDAEAAYRVLVGALGWAASQDTRFAFGEVPFDDRRLEQLTELLARLTAAGFDGAVRLDAHLGEFCMQVDDTTGRYRLADPGVPLSACEVVGNPLAEATPAAAQSDAFQEFLDAAPMLSRGGIDLEVVLRGSRDSQRLYDFPPDVATAGEWNAIATRNNRVEFSLFPRSR